MVTKSDYLRAKEIIVEYEELLSTLIEKGNEWDIDLIPILSTFIFQLLKYLNLYILLVINISGRNIMYYKIIS